jgi:hypothetical protein
MGIEPVTDRTARNYMALARFRATSGKRFPELMTLSISCLYPVLTLPEGALADPPSPTVGSAKYLITP